MRGRPAESTAIDGPRSCGAPVVRREMTQAPVALVA